MRPLQEGPSGPSRQAQERSGNATLGVFSRRLRHCPKPKDPTVEVTLDGLCPLISLEVIRKLWVGIIITRITRAWERHGILTDAQLGFRPGRGTDTALPQFINAREHAEEMLTTRPAGTSAEHLTPSHAMELSCTRFGVPSDISHWLATMDLGGPTAIRSPWALLAWSRAAAPGFGTTPSLDRHCTFHRERGTPQGDVSSPHNCFFDIALRALHLDR